MSLGTTIVAVIVGLLALIALGRRAGVEIHRRNREGEFAVGKRLMVVRDVSAADYPWLNGDVPAGTIVFEYLGPTYGLGQYEDLIFVSLEAGAPCFQLPRSSLEETNRDPATVIR